MFYKIPNVLSGNLNDSSLWENISGALKYADLENLKNLKDSTIVSKDRQFYVIKNPQEKRFSIYYGWKLHVSVAPEDIEKAFNLAAPLICKYCKCFKVLDLNHISQQEYKEKGERIYVGCQITLYLERDGEPYVTEEHCENMIREITQSFEENNIVPGKTPDSDAKTTSPYFSLRNDRIGKLEYIPANLAGKNYNPSNFANPFERILLVRKKFDINEHFENFGEEMKKEKEQTILLCLDAYLREYCQEENLSEKLVSNFTFLPTVLKESDLNFLKDKTKRESVKFCIILSGWLNDPSPKLEMSPPISQWYSQEDDFKKFIAMFEKSLCIKDLPEPTTGITFKEYMIRNIKKNFNNYLNEMFEVMDESGSEIDKNNQVENIKNFLFRVIQNENGASSKLAIMTLYNEKDLFKMTTDEIITFLTEFEQKPEVKFMLSLLYTESQDRDKAKDYLVKAISIGSFNYINFNDMFCVNGEMMNMFEYALTLLDSSDVFTLAEKNCNFAKLMAANMLSSDEQSSRFNVKKDIALSGKYLDEILNDPTEKDSDIILISRELSSQIQYSAGLTFRK